MAFRKFVLVLSLIFSPAFLGSALLHAQSALVEVEDVKFSSNAGAFKWTQCAIKLKAGKNTLPEAPSTDYVDDVKITLTLGYERSNSSDKFFFYESSVTLVTMESAKSKVVSFWLPYDIVKRDDLPKEPKYWMIKLEVKGEELPMTKDNASRNIKDRKVMDSFLSAASSKLGDTEGILVPTHRSPYGYGAGGRGNEIPAVVWTEAK